MMMPTTSVILYDATSGANAALDTGAIATGDCDSILISLTASGTIVGTPAVTYGTYDASGTALQLDGANLTGSTTVKCLGSWGPGCSRTLGGLLALGMPLPAKIEITVAALGTAITGRLVIIGRKNYRTSGVAT